MAIFSPFSREEKGDTAHGPSFSACKMCVFFKRQWLAGFPDMMWLKLSS